MEQHREEIKQHHHNMAELNVQYASAQRMQMQENHDAAVAAVQSYQNTALGSLQAMHNAATIQANEFANKMDSLHVQLVSSTFLGSKRVTNAR
jgi:murein L,D-transpeptidase YcbB/YkuD